MLLSFLCRWTTRLITVQILRESQESQRLVTTIDHIPSWSCLHLAVARSAIYHASHSVYAELFASVALSIFAHLNLLESTRRIKWLIMLNTNVLFDPLRLLFQTSSKAVLNFSPWHLVIYRAQLLQWCRGYYKLTTVLGPGCRCTTKYPSKLGNVVGSPGSFSVHYISPCILRYSEPTSF